VTEAAKRDVAQEVVNWAAPVSLFGMLVGPGILVWQVFRWLKDGYWTPITLENGIIWAGGSRPAFTWGGVQRISDWSMDLPLSAVVFFAVLIAFGIVVSWADSRPTPR
jgi:hypothetical protein